MDKETIGTVITAKKQWWLKVNTKPVRLHATDGAVFPYIITVEYTVDGTTYTKKKWIRAGGEVPSLGSTVAVSYDGGKPSRSKVMI